MRVIIAIVLLALTGCNTTGDVTLPRAPAWVQPGDARTFDNAAIVAEIRRILPGVKIAGISDRQYTLVSYKWLKDFVDWTWHAAPAAGITYRLNTFDCENFTNLFNEVVALKASQAGVNAAPLAAAVSVQFSPTSLHALVGVATDRGIFIVEPQPDAGPFRITALADYKQPILAVELGLASPF